MKKEHKRRRQAKTETQKRDVIHPPPEEPVSRDAAPLLRPAAAERLPGVDISPRPPGFLPPSPSLLPHSTATIPESSRRPQGSRAGRVCRWTIWDRGRRLQCSGCGWEQTERPSRIPRPLLHFTTYGSSGASCGGKRARQRDTATIQGSGVGRNKLNIHPSPLSSAEQSWDAGSGTLEGGRKPHTGPTVFWEVLQL